ncbi:cobalamin biosynthesis protein CbiX [Hydrogenophaga crassostreae]|uniref:Cobalamin biosynthesis protein CbiX n=1 Tax=Hydrogenophaga crassostreae TaxID=1763535 RepID=A0A162Z0I3_9BURK|nr:CbiX/SirB N-terminal domain-containing protein [Hydrogenophaga crassostreae]AOW13191.1 cobalamin biosynthesis protein CbiX [Hydrogenophaga crassostreae]OAD42661.1 cobalamin biosynthesis protein CbiX [Hydrogenophaga crassostreae]
MLGVIVFAHGSRDPLWRTPVEAVATRIGMADGSVLVCCAYLELCEPDLPAAAAQLVARGATHIRILPLFFGMGKHAREDLPALLASLKTTHPGIQIDALPTAGENPRLTDLLAEIALDSGST